MSDFNHQLSKIHEQFAEDSALLVEEFRKRTSDILNDGFVYIYNQRSEFMCGVSLLLNA